MTYERTTNASRRAQARSQTRFSHVSLWYEKQGDSTELKDQKKCTSSKRLTAAEREEKELRTSRGKRAARKAAMEMIAAGDVIGYDTTQPEAHIL